MSLYDSSTYMQDLETAASHSVGIEHLSGKKILITGATGTIGSFLVDLLLHYDQTDQADITVYAASRSVKRLEERFRDVMTEQLIFVPYDCAKPVEFECQADYIIHAAGNAFPAAFNKDPVGTIVNNVLGTYNLLEYGRTHGAKRFLYVSSGEVYGQGDLSLEAFDEAYGGYVDPVSPRSCYPNSKRTAETLCASFSKEYGLETVIVRPCHTYGPSITENDNRAHAQFIRDVLDGKDIILTSAGTQMRSYCYVADCASAILTVLINGQSGEAYNIANPNARVTIAGFAEIVAETAGRKVIFADPDEKDLADRTPIAKQVLDTKKLEGLGWRGVYSVQDGIADVLAILQGQ